MRSIVARLNWRWGSAISAQCAHRYFLHLGLNVAISIFGVVIDDNYEMFPVRVQVWLQKWGQGRLEGSIAQRKFSADLFPARHMYPGG
jgi:hypothetical protein